MTRAVPQAGGETVSEQPAAPGNNEPVSADCLYRGENAVVAADRYRIEADCLLRDVDRLELEAGIMAEALEKIANPRRNMSFDPWARDVALAALASARGETGT